MRIIHRLVGYDRQTERLRLRFDIPDHLMPEAKKIVRVPADDPDAAWSYPLTEAKAAVAHASQAKRNGKIVFEFA